LVGHVEGAAAPHLAHHNFTVAQHLLALVA
jgi:hypothetical protein